MNGISKSLALIVVLIIAFSNLTIVKVAFSQAAPTISPPEFTVKYDTNASDYPLIMGNMAGFIMPNHFSNNQTAVIIIKNEPINSPSNNTYYFYNLRVKDSTDSTWAEIYNNNLQESPFEYTIIRDNDNSSAGTTLEFQVQAVLQNETVTYFNNLLPGFPAVFQQDNVGYKATWTEIASSDWSNVQTLTIPDDPTTVVSSVTIPDSSTTPGNSIDPHSSSSPENSQTLASTISSNPLSSPILTSPPTQVIVQSVPTWFYSIVIMLVAIIVVLLGIIALTQRRNKATKNNT